MGVYQFGLVAQEREKATRRLREMEKELDTIGSVLRPQRGVWPLLGG
ncbi:hypothetical protein GCM10009771_06330 [Nesterenkonia flava]